MDPRDPGTPAAKRRLDGDACIEDDIDEIMERLDDLELKTAPESSHRVTMERLTVALCRWYGGGRRRG